MTAPVSSADLLRGTVYLASLARRAALASDDPIAREQALKLAPVAQELKELARGAGRPAADPPPPSAILRQAQDDSSGQALQLRAGHPERSAAKLKDARRAVGAVSAPDFQILMDAAATKRDPAAALMSDSLDRTTVALSMARGGANPVEIAKSLGLTRGEVDLIITIANQK